MTKTCHALIAAPNLVPNKCSVDFSWRELLLGIFPEKTAAYVATFTHTSVAAVAHIMRGRNGPSGPALMNLLRSKIGPRILDAIVGDVDWRADELRLIELAKLQLQLEEQKRRLGSLRRQVGE
jgi:hypothetical protein